MSVSSGPAWLGLLTIALLLAVSAGWMAEIATTYGASCFGRIPTVGR